MSLVHITSSVCCVLTDSVLFLCLIKTEFFQLKRCFLSFCVTFYPMPVEIACLFLHLVFCGNLFVSQRDPCLGFVVGAVGTAFHFFTIRFS